MHECIRKRCSYYYSDDSGTPRGNHHVLTLTVGVTVLTIHPIAVFEGPLRGSWKGKEGNRSGKEGMAWLRP